MIRGIHEWDGVSYRRFISGMRFDQSKPGPAPRVAQLDEPRLAEQPLAQVKARDQAELASVEDRVRVRAHQPAICAPHTRGTRVLNCPDGAISHLEIATHARGMRGLNRRLAFGRCETGLCWPASARRPHTFVELLAVEAAGVLVVLLAAHILAAGRADKAARLDIVE